MTELRFARGLGSAILAGALTLPLAACSDSVEPIPIDLSISPPSSRVQAGTSQNFTAVVLHDGRERGVDWTLHGAGCTGDACGTLSATSSDNGAAITYYAPASPPSPARVTLTAVSLSDGKVSRDAFIDIQPPPILVNLLGTFSANIGGQAQISASIANDPSGAGVTWALSGTGCAGAACGTLSASTSADGQVISYTAPAVVPNPNFVTITATSVADHSVSASISMTITSSIQVALTPSGFIGVDVSTTELFSAAIANDPGNLGVTWTLTCTGDCGTITPTGLYTAPGTVPTRVTVTVVATSITDYTRSAAATVVITTPGVITVVVSPSSGRMGVGTSRPFTAYLFHDPADAGVSWTASAGSFSSTTSGSGVAVTYHAPSVTGAVTITATSVTDPLKFGTATVSVFRPTCNPRSCR